MSIISKLKSPKLFLFSIVAKTSKLWPDYLYLKFVFRIHMGYWPDFRNPETFGEKLNWMKLYRRNPVYTDMADKYNVKEFVRKIIGDEFVVKNYGVWNKFEDIDFSLLPEMFVLKCTHDSSGAIICKDKNTFDIDQARKKINQSIKKNYFYILREWVYKNISPRIIADEFLDDGRKGELQDYKFWCFNGTPRVMYMTNKGKNVFENFYDMEFNPLDINHGFPRVNPEYSKPQSFDKMKELAEKLSKGIPFVRVDFFEIKGKPYFAEFTFYDWGGLKPFKNKEWDIRLGTWIDLGKA